MSRAVMQQALSVLEASNDTSDECLDTLHDLREALAQPEQEPVAFPSRRAVERAIESVENPKGMHLNDGKERVILPGGTLRYMLALIDHTSPPQRQPLTDEQDRALCEAYCNDASDEYFKARSVLDFPAMRRIFYAGHRKAWITRDAAHSIGDKT